MGTKIDRIRKLSENNVNMQFTSLYHLINEELLLECYWELDPNKALGIDGVDKELYGENVTGNLMELVEQLKKHAYRPRPTRRVYIPKNNGKKRPLGLLCLEDKLVQMAVKKVLEAVYEPRFLDCMFGFRPGKRCHGALKTLNWIIEKRKTQWVLEADICSYFDHISHDRLLECLKIKIKDPNILRLISRMLKAGIMEAEEFKKTEEGTVQGGNLSPLLANIYMHYMLTLWFYKEVRTKLNGEAWLINYADDFIACFAKEESARKFLEELRKRLKDFNLELQEEKTKLVEFGSNAEAGRKKRGLRKPETIQFLGFTHYCSQSRTGNFRVKRKTDGKRLRRKISEMSEWIKSNRNTKTRVLIKQINSKLRGHYQYYGVTDNIRSMSQYCYETEKALYKWLNRRSQRRSYDWPGFRELMKYCPLEKPKIYHKIYQATIQT